MQNSINRQLGIASVNAYKPLALLCFIIEVHTLLLNLPHVSDIALAAVARHLCSYLPPNFRGGFLARAELLAATCVPRGRSYCADEQRDIQFAPANLILRYMSLRSFPRWLSPARNGVRHQIRRRLPAALRTAEKAIAKARCGWRSFNYWAIAVFPQRRV